MTHRRKTCRTCGAVKLLRHFHKCKTAADGYRGDCKACKRQAIADNYQLKRDQLLAKRRRQWREDPEHRRRREASIRRWQQSERGKQAMRESRHAWNVLNPEKVHAIRRRVWHRTGKQRRAARAIETANQPRTNGAPSRTAATP